MHFCTAPFLLLAVTLVELLNTSACSNVTLTSCEERMALGTNVYTQLLFSGAGLKSVSAATSYSSLEKLRMDSFFHYLHLTFPQIGIITSLLCEGLVLAFASHSGKAGCYRPSLPVPNNYIIVKTLVQYYNRQILLEKKSYFLHNID